MPDPRPPLAAAGPAALASALWIGAAGVPLGALAARTAGHHVDGLGLALATLTLFVAAVVASFSRRHMRADPRAGAYFATLGALVASVLVLVASGNLVDFGAGWVASGALLARLIGHDRSWPEARATARRARIAFAVGDTALLGGLALAGLWAGSARIAVVLAAAPAMPPALATLAALLLLTGAAARCALPPFAPWLLSSMTAPTPVSALMHAGLVNAGGLVLLRFAPLLEAAPLARQAAIALGLIAAAHGHLTMLVRPDVKRALAGSTVAQMGFMVMSCGLGAYGAALWHLVAHGLFKAWLFLGSGSAAGVRRTAPPPARLLPAGALLTFAAGVALVLAGKGGASLIPLLLGAATAASTVLAAVRSAQPVRVRLGLVGGIGLLALLHAAGLGLATALVGPDAPSPLPPAALLALLAGFLAAWVWLARRAALPPRLYVRLLNAGAIQP